MELPNASSRAADLISSPLCQPPVVRPQNATLSGTSSAKSIKKAMTGAASVLEIEPVGFQAGLL